MSSSIILFAIAMALFIVRKRADEIEYSEQCSPYKGLNPYLFTARQRTQSTLLTNHLSGNGHTFLKACLKAETDKCTGHAYQFPYSKYLTGLRKKKVVLFEIGLGCGQNNLGASVRLWTSFFPDLELHIMEFDRSCGEKWYAGQSVHIKEKVKIHYGDQSKEEDLLRVIKE